MNARFFLIGGLIFMILAVLLGAFGAHAIKPFLSEQHIQTWKTASDYHFYHALGLISFGIWGERRNLDKLAIAAATLLIIGIIFFSGSLYLLAITGINKLGMITPIGGMMFILGWMLWLGCVFRESARDTP